MGYGYFILAQILEKVSNKPLAVLLKENILLPAGMNHTGLNDSIWPLRNKALGYYRLSDTYINEPYLYVPNTLGAASIYSTAYDLYLWDRILYANTLLSPESTRSYSSPHYTISPDYAYGFGWEFARTALSPADTIETMEHSGASRAFRANIFRIPSEKKCIILLSNSANQSAYELFENIMKLFRGGNWKEPQKLLADTLYSIMQRTSVEDAIQAYKDLKRTEPAMFDFSSYSLELLGERLLLIKNYESAAAIFQLAVEMDPDYTYGYYFMGRAFEKGSKIQEALRAYQAAVRKDKDSRPGIDAAFQIKYLQLSD